MKSADTERHWTAVYTHRHFVRAGELAELTAPARINARRIGEVRPMLEAIIEQTQAAPLN